MEYQEIEKLFNRRKNDNKFNTSYPLTIPQWASYLSDIPLKYKEDSISLYIHIPFCNKICSFCEYSKILTPSTEIQVKYLQTLANDINSFLDKYNFKELNGFDIGGGTPTSLSDESFEMLMSIYSKVINKLNLSHDFEPSIEGTFTSINDKKLQLIASNGIKRISFGIQSACKNTLKLNNRDSISSQYIKNVINKCHTYGINKVNVDLMYGLNGQTFEDIQNDLKELEYINADQVTLYELRDNMISQTCKFNKDKLFSFYEKLYEEIISLGYYGEFGQNTFSKNKEDMGLSSYLRNRMFNGCQYKGFGISAQSMSDDGLSYNIGKSNKNILKIISNNISYENYMIYKLPNNEVMSKYIAISGYSGGFNLKHIYDLKINFKNMFENQIKFCLDNNYIIINGDRIKLTQNGFRYYGAVLSLFYMQK